MSTININGDALDGVWPGVAGFTTVTGQWQYGYVGGTFDGINADNATGGFAQTIDDATLNTNSSVQLFLDWPSHSNDTEVGAMWINSSKTGFSAFLDVTNTLTIRKEVSGSPGAIITTVGSLSIIGTPVLLVTFNNSTGAITVSLNGSQISTATYTDTLTALHCGFQMYQSGARSDTNIQTIVTTGAGASYTIDSITTDGNPGLVVGEPFSIATTGLGDLAEVDIQTLSVLGSTVVATSLSAPSGDGTAVMPYWVDLQKYPFPGSVSVDAVETGMDPNVATDSDVPLGLPANYIDVQFATITTFDDTWLGYALNAIGRPLASGDRAYWPNVNSLTFGTDSKISIDLGPGLTYTTDLWVQKVDSTMQYYSVTINSEGAVTDVRGITSRGITSRGITSRNITSRSIT